MTINLALTFLGLALIAGMLGFTGVAFTAAATARILFNLFLFLFLVAVFWRLCSNPAVNRYLRELFGPVSRD